MIKIPLQGRQPCAPEKFSWASPEVPKGNTGYLGLGWAQHSVKRKMGFRTTRGTCTSASGTQSLG